MGEAAVDPGRARRCLSCELSAMTLSAMPTRLRRGRNVRAFTRGSQPSAFCAISTRRATPARNGRFAASSPMRAMLFAAANAEHQGAGGGPTDPPDGMAAIRLCQHLRVCRARHGRRRRFRQAVVFVPKGNGKTTISAPLAMYLTFGEGEGGAEGYAAAVTRDQARILFEVAQNMVRRSPADAARMGRRRADATRFFSRRPPRNSCRSARTRRRSTGSTCNVAVCDEIGSHRTSEVYDALSTAMGKEARSRFSSRSRPQPANTAGIGKQLWDYLVRLLSQSQADDRLWGVIYTIDDGDDPWAEETWIKANPGWGQAVQPDAIRAIMRQARNNPAQEAAARTRHLNMWIGADEALFSLRAWNACADPELVDRRFHRSSAVTWRSTWRARPISPRACCCSSAGWPTMSSFCRCYLNEGALLEARNAVLSRLGRRGRARRHARQRNRFRVDRRATSSKTANASTSNSIAYDPWAATQLAQRLSDQGLPMVEFRATTQNFSEPTKELEAAIRVGRHRA